VKHTVDKCAHEIENNTAPPPALNLADRGSSLTDPKSADACDTRLTQFSFLCDRGWGASVLLAFGDDVSEFHVVIVPPRPAVDDQ
jgi:hypothetical protein